MAPKIPFQTEEANKEFIYSPTPKNSFSVKTQF